MARDLNHERQEAHALLDMLPPENLNAVRSLLTSLPEKDQKAVIRLMNSLGSVSSNRRLRVTG